MKSAIIVETSSSTHLSPLVTWYCLLKSAKFKKIYFYSDLIFYKRFSSKIKKLDLKNTTKFLSFINLLFKSLSLKNNKIFIFPTLNHLSLFQWFLLLIPNKNILCFGTHSLNMLSETLSILKNKKLVDLKFRKILELLFLIVLINKKKAILTAGNTNQKKFLISIGFPKERLAFIPFAISHHIKNDYRMKLKSLDNSFIEITIPGIYSQERRDYIGFIEYLEKSNILTEFNKLKFNFLGAPPKSNSAFKKGKCFQIINMLEKISNKYPYQISYFNSFVTDDIYMKILFKTNFIISPAVEIFRGKDRYGISKDTGCFYDALSSLTPLFVPNHLPIPDEFSDFVFHYDSFNDFFEFVKDSKVSNSLFNKQLLDDFKNLNKKFYSYENLINLNSFLL